MIGLTNVTWLTVIPSVISLAERFFGAGKGKQKEAAVVDIVQLLVKGLNDEDPEEELIKEIITALVKYYNKKGIFKKS